MNPNAATLTNDARFILYHKQSTSARTLFLRHASGSVVTPAALPPLSSLIEATATDADRLAVLMHPAALARELCRLLQYEPALLQADGEYHQRVETPRQTIDVYLARFTSIDPPREQVAGQGGTFCAITELRGRGPAEMALLRKAYEVIMGG